MRILVCAKADLPSLVALNRLLPALAGHGVQVLLTDKTRPAELTSPELGIVKFLERDLPFKLLFPLLEREHMQPPPPLRTYAQLWRDLGFPVATIRRINLGDGFALACAFRPDLVVSIRFSLLFRPPMLQLPRYGILNLHPGPLPGYAGLFTIFRQMLAGEKEIGITLHKVDEGIDTGPVVSTTPLAVEPGRSMLWHVLRAYRAGVGSILDAIAKLEADGQLPASPQDLGHMHYYRLPEAAGFARFADAGLKLYDFDEYAADLGTWFGTSVAAIEYASG